MSLIQLQILALFGISAVALIFVALQPYLAKAALARRRLGMIIGDHASVQPTHGDGLGKRRRRSVEDTLREIEGKQKALSRSRSRQTLQIRLREAGMTWSKNTFWAVSAATGMAICLILWAGTSVSLPTSAVVGVLGGALLPHGYLRFRRNRRLTAFAAQFADSVDVIVRGVRSGMPLGDCIRVIAIEGQEPVRSEFKAVVDDQTLGVPIQEAVQRMAERVRLPETNFLSIVITIQSRSGGNLTEALGNLSTVLRERKKMRSKIRAMSAEAKASGGIIGSLPPIVASLLYLTSPEYISLLFTTTMGNVVLTVSAIWMMIGILIMRKMINFDF
ncbi:MAG: type II secretion system F family protein [Candidatus Saccharibacteria bacterium]|nr:type II secretion system F family protein [Pseudorhodobacter sp.]